MRARSIKRAKQEREYAKVRERFLQDEPICEFEGCLMISEQVHHKKGRIGTLLTDRRYFLAVCPVHHQWIEDHPKLAKQKGYSLSRLAK